MFVWLIASLALRLLMLVWLLRRFECRKNGEHYAHDMIGDFNNHVVGFIDWNLALDAKGG